MSTIIELRDIVKTYHIGHYDVPVLKGINFKVDKGELVSIMGASGSGKSTMMNIIGLLDRLDEGLYLLNNKDVLAYTEDELATIRNHTIGFVFQTFFLLPRLDAVQNVALPLLYRGIRGKACRQQCIDMLERVGMGKYIDHKPSELSGGQQQRVAIARALVGNPSVILADEPTGALDSTMGKEVMELFIHLNHHDETTIIIITHDPDVAAQCKRTVHIKDGNIVQ